MRRAAAIVGLIGAACGDPLVGPEFVGTPELTVGGVVVQVGGRIPASHGDLALSVFWISDTPEAAVEQEARLDSGLAEYSMTLFDAPPAGASGFENLAGGGQLAIGVIALYADRDENEKLDLAQDLLLGASAQHLLVFAGSRLQQGSAAAALLGEIDAGYHVYEHDRSSACRFVDRASCAPEGGLTRAGDPKMVALSLWETPEQVLVPAPALQQGSIWSAPQ